MSSGKGCSDQEKKAAAVEKKQEDITAATNTSDDTLKSAAIRLGLATISPSVASTTMLVILFIAD
jgi:hypothetical protein